MSLERQLRRLYPIHMGPWRCGLSQSWILLHHHLLNLLLVLIFATLLRFVLLYLISLIIIEIFFLPPSMSLTPIVRPTLPMSNKLDFLHKSHIWDIVDLPPTQSAIGCRWVYKIKTQANGCSMIQGSLSCQRFCPGI